MLSCFLRPLTQWGGRLLAVTWALQLEGFPCHPLEPGHLSLPRGCGQITQEPKRTPAQERFLRVRVRVGSPDVFVASEGPSAPSRGAGPRTQAGVTGSWRWGYGQRPRWHVGSHYLFLRNPCPSPEKDSGCRTVTPLAEMFGGVQSLRRRPFLPGREPAVCPVHLPAPPAGPRAL